MANDDGAYRALSGWKKITRTIGVIGLIVAGLTLFYGRTAIASELLLTSLALMLTASVLEWMGEVEYHLRQIAADTARSVDRQNGISAKMDKLAKDRQDSDGQ